MWKPAPARVAVLYLAILLSGCAGNPVSELYEFYPVETNTDSKRFSYEVILEPGTRGSARPPNKTISFTDMRRELRNYMQAYPYCREGYFVYDEVFDGRKYALLGECQESK